MRRIIGLGSYAQGLNIVLKILITVLLFWALQRQLSGKVSDIDLSYFLQDLDYRYLLAVILLMPLNWVLEALKWRLFLSGAHQLTLFHALRAVLAGLTFSIFTPNRTGDYIGRIVAVKADKNGPVLIATLAGSLCQLSILLFFGWLGLLYFVPKILPNAVQDYKVFLIIGLLGTIGLLFFIIYMRRIFSFAVRQKILHRYKDTFEKYTRLFEAFHWRTFTKAFLIAGFRYSLYVSQYVLMLYSCRIEVPLDMAYAGIATIFLAQTSIPLPPAIGLLARGEIALVVWSSFSDDPIRILVASFGLFVINLALPSLIGLGAILKINILQSLGYEKTKN